MKTRTTSSGLQIVSTSEVEMAIGFDDGASMEARVIGALSTSGGCLTLTLGWTASLLVLPGGSTVLESPLRIRALGRTYTVGDEIDGGGGYTDANGDPDLLEMLRRAGLDADSEIIFWQS